MEKNGNDIMSRIKDTLHDLLELEYYSGLNAGRWEQNEYDRVFTTQKWNCYVERMAQNYGIEFNHDNVDFNDEYDLDEFTFELKEHLKNKLLYILNLE